MIDKLGNTKNLNLVSECEFFLHKIWKIRNVCLYMNFKISILPIE